MVEFRNVTLGYGGGAVVEGVSLTLRPGEVTTILGPNGSGKSTLLKSVLGLVPRVQGEILVEGQPLSRFSSTELARRVSWLPQSRRVPDMTAGQLVLHGRFPWLGYPRRYRDCDRTAARAALAHIGIEALWDTPLAQLSGGTRQKCYFAMALAQGTQTLLLDEPTANLDIGHRLKIMELCRALAAEGKAVALVLHDLDLALSWADRIVLVSGGGIAAQGTPRAVLDSGALEKAFGVRIYEVQTPIGVQYVCGKE